MRLVTKLTRALLGPDEALAQKKKPFRGELGVGGVQFMSGLIRTDEYNENLTGMQAVEMWDKMRRTDAQVAALINACRLPLLSAAWDVDRPSNDEQAERITDEHLEFARDNLFRRIDFPAFLEHALSCLWAGYAVCEIVYDLDGQKVVLKKLAPRLATTIDKWFVDETGDLVSIEQYAYKGSTYETIPIPRDKIALFTYGKEANNYMGMSLLRAVYKHWYIKDTVYKLDAIRCERYAVGVPKITLPEDYDEDLYNTAVNIGKNWKGGAQSFAVLPNGMDVAIVELRGGEALDLLSTINHHNEEIAKVGLAQFINLGFSDYGSKALASVTQEFFYDAEESWARAIAQTICTDVLWPLMDLNFPGQLRPIVVVHDIGAVGLNELVETMTRLGTQYLPANLDLENAVRDRLHLARRTQEEYDQERKEASERASQAQGAPPSVKPPKDSQPPKGHAPSQKAENHTHLTELPSRPSQVAVPAEKDFWRPLRPSERHLALRQMSGMIDDTRDRLIRLMIVARNEWVEELGNQVHDRFALGPTDITQVGIPREMLTRAKDRVSPVLDEVYDYGFKQVRKELRTQRADLELRDDLPDEMEVSALVDARVSLMITRLSRKTEEAIKAIALDMYRTVGPDDFSMDEVAALVARAVDTTEYEMRVTATVSVSETFNLGRAAAAEALSAQIQVCEYSAIMDENTCGTCSLADGKRVQLGSTEYYDLMPPLRSGVIGSCQGLDKCRCIWVYILKEG